MDVLRPGGGRFGGGHGTDEQSDGGIQTHVPSRSWVEPRRTCRGRRSEGADQIRRIGVRAHAIRRGSGVEGSANVRSSARNAGSSEGTSEAVESAGATGRSTGGGQQESADRREVRGAQQP
jgi:hypothetical protein